MPVRTLTTQMSDPTPIFPAENKPEIEPKTDNRSALRAAQTKRRLKIAGLAAGIPLTIVLLLALVFYIRYSRLIDRQLQAGPFADSVNIYAAPLQLSAGDAVSESDLAAELGTGGYKESQAGNALSWRRGHGYIEIFPANTTDAPTRVFIANNQIDHIQIDGK